MRGAKAIALPFQPQCHNRTTPTTHPRLTPMTLKQQLLQEIEQIPEPLLSQILDFLLFIKERHSEEDITEQEHANIIAAQNAYQAGDYLTLEEYEATQP